MHLKSFLSDGIAKHELSAKFQLKHKQIGRKTLL